MTHNASRREFLRIASTVGAVAGSATPWALNLAGIGAAAAQTAPTDYKALVCVFLFGGNDHSNTIIPFDQASYDAYELGRRQSGQAGTSLALPRLNAQGLPNLLQLNETTPSTNPSLSGRSIAMRPEMTGLKALYDQGRVAVLANVGPLIVPTTRDQYRQRQVPLPSGLFSHNDQQSTWMTGTREGARIGYGGLLGDMFAAGNQFQNFTCMSASGTSVFLSGRSTAQMQVGNNGGVQINALTNQTLFGGQNVGNMLRTIMTADRGHTLEKDYNTINRRAADAAAALNNALATFPATAAPFNTFPNTGLGNQLRNVARIIAARNALGARRQVFFTSIGGFDQHSGLVAGHGGLWTQISAAMSAFYAALSDPTIGMANNVTAFTASDFGRTLDSNGQGSDHSWGAHHLIMGGAVRGGETYGVWPETRLGGPNDVGRGSLLPTTSVEQYAGTLARWFGVPSSSMTDVVPRAANWSTLDLGFMNAA
jgi:uncharacterized protein (DUF1501 family)